MSIYSLCLVLPLVALFNLCAWSTILIQQMNIFNVVLKKKQDQEERNWRISTREVELFILENGKSGRLTTELFIVLTEKLKSTKKSKYIDWHVDEYLFLSTKQISKLAWRNFTVTITIFMQHNVTKTYKLGV